MKAEMEEAYVNRVSVNQCAQCQADIIAPEWSEHQSDYCVRHYWSCDACGYPKRPDHHVQCGLRQGNRKYAGRPAQGRAIRAGRQSDDCELRLSTGEASPPCSLSLLLIAGRP